ncbi:uncharacterized protein EMH_0054820 [Eimeria mitis]|uniref:Uncharacterized protein n=1 Tax=Eimeria mitis TaxID=44415 RepID=U6JXA5_9EIME|nr:uncharacterized protein EMH_0054820 [Eimeria mitis]CDJ30049.1 hypothetical protein EMH_0054820 [Eimeria mitis]
MPPLGPVQPLRLPLETIWRRAVEIVERLTGFTLVPVSPAPGETWHWSVLKFELHPIERGWELGGPLTRACVVEEKGSLRQTPCCALVSNFEPPARFYSFDKGFDV